MVHTCTEHTRSGKYHFLRQILLFQPNPVVMFTTCTEHTRSGKLHFLRQILLQYSNPVVMVTTCTEHTRSKKMPLFESYPVTIASPSCRDVYLFRQWNILRIPLWSYVVFSAYRYYDLPVFYAFHVQYSSHNSEKVVFLPTREYSHISDAAVTTQNGNIFPPAFNPSHSLVAWLRPQRLDPGGQFVSWWDTYQDIYFTAHFLIYVPRSTSLTQVFPEIHHLNKWIKQKNGGGGWGKSHFIPSSPRG